MNIERRVIVECERLEDGGTAAPEAARAEVK